MNRPRSSTSIPTFSKPRPAEYGRRPMATSTTSASSNSSLPPLAASTLTLTLSPLSSPLVTFVLSLNFMPCLPKIFCVIFAISASMPGPPICPKNSTTVTSVPSLDQTDAISRPMIPPPITTIFLGISCSAIAPVLVMTFFSSIVKPGKGVASLPVAMMMFLARTLVSPPSFRLTAIVCSSANAPVPLMYSTLFFLNKNSMPFVRLVTDVSFAFIMFAMLTLTSLTSIPRFFVSWTI